MKKIAGFILSGYGQAVLCVAGFAWLASFIPVAGVFSSAALALTALNWGVQRSGIILVLSTVVLFLFFALASSISLAVTSYESVFLFALLQWLPILIISQILRTTRSLSLTLNIIALLSLAVVMVISWLIPERAELWDKFFNWVFQGGVLQEWQGKDANFNEYYHATLEIMTGVAIASLSLIWMVSLLLARWWQRLLDTSDSFRSEFIHLKLGKAMAIIGIIFFVALALTESTLIREALLVIMPVFLLQGIATIHCLLCILKNASVWLFAFYAMLVLSPVIPQFPSLLSMLGAVENLVNLRVRMRSKLEKSNKE